MDLPNPELRGTRHVGGVGVFTLLRWSIPVKSGAAAGDTVVIPGRRLYREWLCARALHRRTGRAVYRIATPRNAPPAGPGCQRPGQPDRDPVLTVERAAIRFCAAALDGVQHLQQGKLVQGHRVLRPLRVLNRSHRDSRDDPFYPGGTPSEINFYTARWDAPS